MSQLPRITVFVCCLCFGGGILWGQVNLVPNPSFEDTVDCYWNGGTPEAAEHWYNVTISTPDYLTYKACGPDPYDQTPRTGDAYMGMICYGPSGDGQREYVGIKLLDTLEAGKTYKVNFYVSPDDFSQFRIDKIGLKFTMDQYFESTVYGIIGYADIYNNISIIDDTTGWTEISGAYTALGGETHIILGNFYPDSEIALDSIEPSPIAVSGYYFFDDIQVKLDSAIGIAEVAQFKMRIFPNPCNEKFYIENVGFSDQELLTVTVENMFGKILCRKQYFSSNYPELIYLPSELRSQILIVNITTASGKTFINRLFIN